MDMLSPLWIDEGEPQAACIHESLEPLLPDIRFVNGIPVCEWCWQSLARVSKHKNSGP